MRSTLAWTVAAFTPCLLATAVVVAWESRQRSTDLPSLDEWLAAGRAALRRVRSSFVDESNRSSTATSLLANLAWVVFGPALAVRCLIHVGAAVAIEGGDPGEIDALRVVASPLVDVDRWTDLRLRLATACYGGFWLMNGTRAMDPAGRMFFAMQLAVLLIGPVAWAGHWALSSFHNRQTMTRHSTHQTETHR